MIEAINASISNAQVLRAVSEEASTSQSANPARIQKAAVTAPYLSPHVRLAPNTKPVFVVRDSDTGSQIKQFPTEAQIRAYQKAGEVTSQSISKSTDASDPSASTQRTITPEQARILMESSVEFKEERAAVRYKNEVAVPGKFTSTIEYQEAVPGSFDQQA